MPDQPHIGRRDFIKSSTAALGTLGVLSQSALANQPAKPTTVHDVIEHILNHFGDGVDRLTETIDTLKTGDASRPVNRIVTTFMATTTVIKQAIQLNADFIITHEPTFYSHRDTTDWLENDPVYQHKRKLLDEHHITVWRYHDHIHNIQPDPIFTGLIDRLGWSAFADPHNPRLCTIPKTTLAELVAHCKHKLGTRAMNYVGNPDMPCSRIALCPGAAGGKTQISVLSEGNFDVAICGEIAEWETNIYVSDSQHTDKPLGLIVTGHRCSEEDGMRVLADWLKTQYPNTPIQHIPANDAFNPA